MKRVMAVSLVACVLAATSSCAAPFWRARFSAQPAVDQDAPFLKCHIASGAVYVLDKWQADAATRVVSGRGILYDVDRNVVRHGEFHLPFDDVVIFETNRPESVVDTSAVVMGVMTGASLTLSALCLTNPKACFGSCPTFFVSDGVGPKLQAEGFSEAVAPSLERADVDALFLAESRRGPLEVRMTNDALETHVVDSVRILAVPKPAGGRVFHTRGGYWAASAVAGPLSCRAASGNCMAAVENVDDAEYRSFTDGEDLATPETVELEFRRPRSGKVGLVVRARNTLLNTFLFYQVLAYTGLSAGDWLMRLERSDPQTRAAFGGPGKLLGDIDVKVERDGRWIDAGVFSEVGPIAKETQLVTFPDLPAGEAPLRVRLTMTRGNWRIDHVALAELDGIVAPTALDPVRVVSNGADDPEALAKLTDAERRLVTYPGDAFTISFDLPDDGSELFLESRGYYVEWIREQWLVEEDAGRVGQLLLDPRGTLRRLAPEFKKLEPTMEQVFWQSGYAR